MAQLVTFVVTIFGGIAIFFLSQVLLVLFIERIRIQARTIEEISEAIVFYGREYSAPLSAGEPLTSEKWQKLRDAADNLRRLSARLRATATTLRYYTFFETLRLILPKNRVIDASKSLMGLSNLIPPAPNDIALAIKFRKEIEDNLDIKIPKP